MAKISKEEIRKRLNKQPELKDQEQEEEPKEKKSDDKNKVQWLNQDLKRLAWTTVIISILLIGVYFVGQNTLILDNFSQSLMEVLNLTK